MESVALSPPRAARQEQQEGDAARSAARGDAAAEGERRAEAPCRSRVPPGAPGPSRPPARSPQSRGQDCPQAAALQPRSLRGVWGSPHIACSRRSAAGARGQRVNAASHLSWRRGVRRALAQAAPCLLSRAPRTRPAQGAPAQAGHKPSCCLQLQSQTSVREKHLF